MTRPEAEQLRALTETVHGHTAILADHGRQNAAIIAQQRVQAGELAALKTGVDALKEPIGTIMRIVSRVTVGREILLWVGMIATMFWSFTGSWISEHFQFVFKK